MKVHFYTEANSRATEGGCRKGCVQKNTIQAGYGAMKFDENGIPTKDSDGFNCIGFVGYMYGIKPEYSVADFDSYSQFKKVEGVTKDDPLKNAKVGDVLRLTGTFEDGTGNHVMIYAGNGYVWECTTGSEQNGQGVRYQRFVCQENFYKNNSTSYEFSIYRRKK